MCGQAFGLIVAGIDQRCFYDRQYATCIYDYTETVE